MTSARRTRNTAKPSSPNSDTTAPTADTGPQTKQNGPKTAGPLTNGKPSKIPQPAILDAPPTPREVVVLGKRSVTRSEVEPLRVFGHALALRRNQLVTTKTSGAPAEVVIGYQRGGGSPKYLRENEKPGDRPVIIFTNSKMQADLDETKPGWRDRGWIIVNNPAETEEVANMARIIARERGTPVPE